MANCIKITDRTQLTLHSLPQPETEDRVHTTIIHGPDLDKEFFSDPEIGEEDDLTVIEVPSGEFGAGWSIYEYIRSPGQLLALSIAIIIGKGFFSRLGELLAEKVVGKLANHSLPFKIHLEYPAMAATLIVTVPAKLSKEQTKLLDKCINAKARSLKHGCYGELVFDPEHGTLIPVYWRE